MTHLANFHTLPSFSRRRTMVEWSTLRSSVNILVFKLLSSFTATKSAWSYKFDGQPFPSSSLRFVPLDFNFLNHLSTWLLLIVPSPNSSLISQNDRVAIQPFSKEHNMTNMDMSFDMHFHEHASSLVCLSGALYLVWFGLCSLVPGALCITTEL